MAKSKKTQPTVNIIPININNSKEIFKKYKTIIIAAGAVVVLLALILIFGRGGSEQKASEIITSSDVINLKLVAQNFVSPVGLVSPNDETGRLFVVDRTGKIIVITKDNQVLSEPMLDIHDRLVDLTSSYDERGLLSMAFHPNFRNNGRFFVYYSIPLRKDGPKGWDHTVRISEFKITKGFNQTELSSEKVIMEIDEPQANHNGGQVAFGLDGLLYISLGDGGNANDLGTGHSEGGNGQDTSSFLGKILRINVDVLGKIYAVPQDNPFVGKQGKPEIFATGFRNPWRMSFDKATGDLYVGDVGQNLWEEINIVKKGQNYGWNKKEGTHCFDPKNPNNSPSQCTYAENLTAPIIEYKNAGKGGIGLANIGGFVYNGKSIPELKGKYIFGDWSSSFASPKGQIFIAEKIGDNWEMKQLMQLNEFVLGFGQDSDYELYVLTTKSSGPTGTSGKVYKIMPKA